jgi:hypothetical protein
VVLSSGFLHEFGIFQKRKKRKTLIANATRFGETGRLNWKVNVHQAKPILFGCVACHLRRGV